ncbi:hypothetical protein Molly5_107 [Maribacter phage Molly_5]|nr:hypothetical protein Molly4_107 [Maribacter phage Molly_4]QQO98197.1 hypothetical protein Molly5_107 [Maribacter phage Molly_5]
MRYLFYTYIIYLKNIPIYVGKGSHKRVQDSLYENKGDRFEIVFESFSEEEALVKETYYIKKFKRILEGGTLRNIALYGLKTDDPVYNSEVNTKNYSDPIYKNHISSKASKFNLSPSQSKRLSNSLKLKWGDLSFREKVSKSVSLSRSKLTDLEVWHIKFGIWSDKDFYNNKLLSEIFGVTTNTLNRYRNGNLRPNITKNYYKLFNK